MFKTLVFLFSILLFVSCGKSGGGGSSSGASSANGSNKAGDAVTLDEVAQDTVVPSAALNFDVNVELDNFNSKQEDKVLEAADLIKKVVASEEFKTAVLNHKFKGKKAFNDNGGMTNAEIYKKIIEGSEKLNPGVDNTMNLDLEVYHENNMTVGYTYPSVIKVWMNSKYLNKNKPYKVTTNMMHEWLHKLGYGHSSSATASTRFTIPRTPISASAIRRRHFLLRRPTCRRRLTRAASCAA